MKPPVNKLNPQQQRLVMEHTYLATHLRRRYARWRSRFPKKELESLAMTGIVRAARAYRRQDGPFKGLAYLYAKGEVLRAVDGESQFADVKAAVLLDVSGLEREGSMLTDTPQSAAAEFARHAQYVAGSYLMNTLAQARSPEEEILHGERDHVVRTLVASIRDDDLRQMLELELEGARLEDAAKRLGLSNATARRRLKAARELLRAKAEAFGLHASG